MSNLKIQRINEDIDRETGALPFWLEQYAAKMDRELTAVDVARKRNESASFIDRIHSIIDGTKKISPYASVEEAVQDYQKRTGLTEYRKLALAQEIMEAGEEEEKKNSKPELVRKIPAIDYFIHNTIETQHKIQLPAILYSILEVFGHEGVREHDLYDKDLCSYINKLLIEKNHGVNHTNDTNIGKGVGTDQYYYEINDSNRDPWSGLMPKKVY